VNLMDGQYEEKLPFGKGTLVVSKTGFFIHFYFPGPDARYKGTSISIRQYDINGYINAYRQNWQTYLELKESFKYGNKELTLKGEKGMTINVGGHFNGVCIDVCHLPISSESELNNIINSLRGAERRGIEIMEQLKGGGIGVGQISSKYEPIHTEKIPWQFYMFAFILWIGWFVLIILNTNDFASSMIFSILATGISLAFILMFFGLKV
jgi:hypothetical protein